MKVIGLNNVRTQKITINIMDAKPQPNGNNTMDAFSPEDRCEKNTLRTHSAYPCEQTLSQMLVSQTNPSYESACTLFPGLIQDLILELEQVVGHMNFFC